MPLCGAVDTNGTPKKVKKARIKQADIITVYKPYRVDFERQCNTYNTLSQVKKAQVSSGSQDQYRPQASCAQIAPKNNIKDSKQNAKAKNW